MNFLIQLKRNAIPQLRNGIFVPIKLKCNLISVIEILHHNLDTAFFAILDRKRISNLLKKADIYQH